MRRAAVEIVREYGPFPGIDHVHGVTHDGRQAQAWGLSPPTPALRGRRQGDVSSGPLSWMNLSMAVAAAFAAAPWQPNSLPPPLYDSNTNTGLSGFGLASLQTAAPNFPGR